MDSLKGSLKYHLDFRIGALTNDSRTFLWVKCYQGRGFYNGKEPPIGGGNFLITLGAFACLNLLAKVYWILSRDQKDYPLIDKEVVREFSTQKRKIKELVKEHGDEFNIFFEYCSQDIRKGYFIREKRAFYCLVRDMYRDKINLGLGTDEEIVNKIWDDLRNAPSHRAVPAREIGGVSPSKPMEWNFSVLDSLEKVYRTAFVKKDGKIIVIAELLNEYVLKIKEWIFKKIDSQTSEDKIKACLGLLEVM